MDQSCLAGKLLDWKKRNQVFERLTAYRFGSMNRTGIGSGNDSMRVEMA